MSIIFYLGKIKNCSFWKYDLKPSEHARKLFFNNSKLCVSSFFAKKYNFYHQNTILDAFRMNSGNIIGRNPSMVIPLLANQDLTPMLEELGWENLHDQGWLRRLCHFFNLRKSNHPEYLLFADIPDARGISCSLRSANEYEPKSLKLFAFLIHIFTIYLSNGMR